MLLLAAPNRVWVSAKGKKKATRNPVKHRRAGHDGHATSPAEELGLTPSGQAPNSVPEDSLTLSALHQSEGRGRIGITPHGDGQLMSVRRGEQCELPRRSLNLRRRREDDGSVVAKSEHDGIQRMRKPSANGFDVRLFESPQLTQASRVIDR